MPLFDVTFEDVGFTTRKKDFSNEPSQKAIDAFNEGRTDGITLVSISASADDSVHKDGKADGEYKVFVSVVLRQEYPDGDPYDYDHAEDEPIMNAARERFFPELGMEGNWETLDYESVDPAPAP